MRRRAHKSTTYGMSVMRPEAIEKIVYGDSLPEIKRVQRLAEHGISAGAAEAKANIEAARKALEAQRQAPTTHNNSIQGKNMTVSLYSSTSTGKREIVVQTNAQSLELFIAGLADAMDAAISQHPAEARVEFLASLLRNAFPVAFAIAGYKAERVSETRMLSCGAADPGVSNLLAHSRT